MFRSIFQKQFVLYMSALAISFTILAAALSIAFNSYFVNQKKNMLEQQGRRISEIYSLYFSGGLSYRQTNSKLMQELSVLHEYLDSSLILIDPNYTIVDATTDIAIYRGATISMDELKPLAEGQTVDFEGRLGGVFSEQVLTVGYPIVINQSVIYSVLLSSSMPELQRNISEMFSITLICLFISATLAFVLVYIFSRTISKPLLEMNAAAKVIASGDFEKRIHVNTKDEIGQLAVSFNNMADSLFEQEKMRRNFISNISHDLRSPLTSIRGFLQAILDGTIPAEKQDYYLNIVMDETERLSKLTNDILDLNETQSAEMPLDKTSFDINDLIRKTVLMFETQIIKKNIRLSLSFADETDLVYADNEKVQRIVYNLLDNAVKFTGSINGTIAIETTIKNKKVMISIKDNGEGISVENQKYIFDRFFKVDDSRGIDRKGSGLGLSIVMAFVKAHGETIELISSEGTGCEFIFSLPLAEND